MRPAAILLFALGIVIIAIMFLLAGGDSLDTKVKAISDSQLSMLIVLAGILISTLGVLLYFLSPARFLRADVASAMTYSGVANINKVLAALMIEAPGVYLPASMVGATRVFITVSGDVFQATVPRDPGLVFVTPGAGSPGILLEPPGHGLLAYAREIGAAFTDEGLENEIKDALENSLELASGVTVKREQDTISVTMSDLANAGLCEAIRKDSPRTCTQTGCPVCSFVACMIAEGTGRMVRIEGVNVKGKTLNATFKLV
jgi:uncharacterized membrane protein YidH (DUF202 family)